MPIGIQILFLISGITCLIIAAYQFYKIKIKSNNFVLVSGIVNDYRKSYGKNIMYYAVIKYEFAGQIYEIPSPIATNAVELLPEIGSIMELKVNPDKPKEAVFGSLKDYIGMFFILIVIGIVFTSIGVLGGQ